MTNTDIAREITQSVSGYIAGRRLLELEDDIVAALDAARAAGREEAARVAEGWLISREGGVFTDAHQHMDNACAGIVAAIRALGDGPVDGGHSDD